MVERISSGIPGLDKLIKGGFVKGFSILLSGTTGTGKTLFGCQFLLEGARKGEKGLYLSLEQEEENILGDIETFSWGKEFIDYVKNGKIVLTTQFPLGLRKLTDVISSLVVRNDVKRFTLDNLSLIVELEKLEGIPKVRRNVFDFIKALKKFNVTSILIEEVPEEKRNALSTLGFEEFLADGVIALHCLEYAGGVARSLWIKKMRRTEHEIKRFPFKITSEGIVLEKQ